MLQRNAFLLFYRFIPLILLIFLIKNFPFVQSLNKPFSSVQNLVSYFTLRSSRPKTAKLQNSSNLIIPVIKCVQKMYDFARGILPGCPEYEKAASVWSVWRS